MYSRVNYLDFVPTIVPEIMNGTKLTSKIVIKDDYVRSDGTSALYLVLYLNKRKRVPLNISVPPKFFDKKKQRVKKNYKQSGDYNLIIEKMLGDLNLIEVNYRLNNEQLTIDRLLEELFTPSLRVNYNVFASKVLEDQKNKGYIKASTYRQQEGALQKIKTYKNPLLFSDINEDFLQKFKMYLKNNLKNKPATIQSTIKNFKKYLHIANKSGIKTTLHYSDITVKSMKGDFTFLLPKELKALHLFYNSPFINATWKNILQRYLFCCFTGLRIGDIEKLTEDNFIENTIVFTSGKTDKFQRIKLNETAKALISFPHIFDNNYTREYINRELKEIAKSCGIKKRLYFHSSRHTFATNYLIKGGQIQNLQKALGHSKIETTMVYAHVVDSLMNEEIGNLDDIVN
ncbi:tyrosine-type recombinase/integrase [Thalassobellus citreus]|uniref:tyrosine-type recombinase/integrase n=1 Tax=Thalassobellus citreus TaxID=3367752 RepID=UPI0037B519CF